MSDTLARIKEALRKVHEAGRPVTETDLYAEEDENGVVYIVGPDGPRAFMSRKVFDELGFTLTKVTG